MSRMLRAMATGLAALVVGAGLVVPSSASAWPNGCKVTTSTTANGSVRVTSVCPSNGHWLYVKCLNSSGGVGQYNTRTYTVAGTPNVQGCMPGLRPSIRLEPLRSS